MQYSLSSRENHPPLHPNRRKALTKRHTHTNIRILHHLRKLLKTNLSIPIKIRFHDRLIHNLLQLLILQITPNHHLQNNKQLPIRDVAVAIDVVDLKCETQFLLFVAFGGECAEPGDEFLEVDVAAAVFVEDCYQTVRREEY